MPINHNRAKECLDALAYRVNVPQLREENIKSYLTVFDENGMTTSQVEHACRVLQTTWRISTYPKPSHFMEAVGQTLKKPLSEHDNKYASDEPAWRLDAAKKLGIPVERLPHDAKDLQPFQLKALDIPRYNRRVKLRSRLGFVFEGFEYSDDGVNWDIDEDALNQAGITLCGAMA